MNETKLIILRGPSGAGKSTVAKRLFEQSSGKVALVEQDYYRFMFKPAGGGGKHNSDTIHRLIQQNVLEVLRSGYDVILEGILSVKSYSEVFEEMFAEHPRDNYIFYFDISLEETLRRHKTRQTSSLFTEDDMRQWYASAHRSGHRFEHIVPEASSIDETLKFIRQTCRIR